MTLKEFGPLRGRVPGVPLDPPMQWERKQNGWYLLNVFFFYKINTPLSESFITRLDY